MVKHAPRRFLPLRQRGENGRVRDPCRTVSTLAIESTVGETHGKERAMQLITSVWRGGSGSQWVKIAQSWADFKTADTGYFNQGLRLVDFEVEGGKYSGVWRPGTGAQWVQPGLSWAA